MQLAVDRTEAQIAFLVGKLARVRGELELAKEEAARRTRAHEDAVANDAHLPAFLAGNAHVDAWAVRRLRQTLTGLAAEAQQYALAVVGDEESEAQQCAALDAQLVDLLAEVDGQQAMRTIGRIASDTHFSYVPRPAMHAPLDHVALDAAEALLDALEAEADALDG